MLQDLDLELETMRAAAPVAASGADKNLDPELEAMRRVDSGGSLADVGFKLLTDRDLDEGFGDLQVSRGFLENIVPTSKDIPFFGAGFEIGDAVSIQQGLARMQRGKATIEDERAVWRWMVDQARNNTSGGTIADLLKSLGTSGAEILTGAGASIALGKGAAKAATKAGLQDLLSKSLAESAENSITKKIESVALSSGAAIAARAGKATAAIGATIGLQEAVPRAAGMEGGAWTAQSVMRAVGMEMTPEQAQQLADDANAAMPMLLEAGGGLMDGMIRQGIEMGSEATGGLLGKLPVVKQINMAFGLLFRKLSGRAGSVGWQKALAEAAQFQGPGGEIAEEFFAAGATAAVMGDKPILEALAEVAEITPEMLAAFAVPGAVGAGITRARGKRGTIQPSAPKALGSEEGGGPAPAAPDASVEGAAAVDPELARQDVEAYTGAVKRATGRDVTMRVVDGELTAEEAAVRGFLRRRNVEVTFIEPEGDMDTAGLPVGFFPSEGRAVVMRGANVAGPAMDEAMHTWESQQTPERRAEYGEALRELDPTFVGQVSRWVAEQPLYRGAAPELLAEEMRTNVARFTAGLVMYLDTAQGRSDFEALWAKEPGKIRRALSALYDWVADKIRVLPRSKQAMARARLRVARNEQDVTKVAMRVLEALNEIRPVAAEGVAPAAQETARPSTGPLGPPVTTERARQRYGMPGATGFMSAIQDRAPDPRNAQFDTDVARGRYGMPGRLTPPGFQRPGDPEAAPVASVAAPAAPAPRRTDTPEQRRANRAARKARAAARVAETAAEKQRIADERQRRRDERLVLKERLERASRRKTERVVEDTDRPIDWESETTADIREFGLGPERPGDRFAAPLPSTITVDGKDRPTTNSDGRPIAADEKALRAFWRWFGDSNVVDAEGRPLVVYRGDPQKQVNRFGPSFEAGIGIFFTTSQDVAETFTVPREYGEPVYFDSDGNEVDPGDVSAVYLSAKKIAIVSRSMAQQFVNDTALQSSGLRQARESGFDGVLVRDVMEGIGAQYLSDNYIVFNPTQIKSATGNVGTFDAANPDIRFAAPDSRTPRQFTWSEYFAPERVAAQHGMGDDPERNVPPPRSRESLLQTPSDAKVTDFLETANRAVEENELPRQGTIGRPDLNVPLKDQGTRALLRAIDEQRLLDQESIPNEQTHTLAQSLFASNPELAREIVEDRMARGEPMSAVDTVVATKVMQALADRAVSTKGTRDDFIDFMRWGNAYREARADTARALQIVRGLGLAGQNAVLDLLSMPAPEVRKEVRRIHKEAPGILGKRVKSRKSNYILGQMGKPASGDKFAAAFDPQTGRPISQQRIDYLQAKLDKIEAQEAERMERAKKALQEAGYDLSQVTAKMLMDPNEGPKIRRIVSVAKASWQDKLSEYILGSMLSGPYTHVKNTSGNIANLVMSGPVQLIAEALTNSIVRDKGSAQWGDVKAYMQGFIHALKPAAYNAMQAWRTEGPAYEVDLVSKGVALDDVMSKIDGFTGPAIGNPVLGRGLRSVSLNLLLASDEFFKTIASTAWAHALAYRTAKGEGLKGDALAVRSAELLNDYTGDLWIESAMKGRETTFQDAGNQFMEKTVDSVMSFRELIDDIGKNVIGLPVGKMLIPFVRTPLRIAANVVRRSPLQPLTYIAAFSGRYKHNQRQLVADTADTMVAMGLLAVAMQLVDLDDDEGRPFITGSTPRNAAQRDLMFRLGVPPMSIRIGDSYYSYKHVEPISTTIGVIIDALKSKKLSGDPAQMLSGVLSGLVAQSRDKTFMRTIGDLQALAEESTSRERRALDMASYSFVSVWVPNVIKQPARATDPFVRDRTQPVEGQGVWYEAAKKLPYDALPIGATAPEAKHDLWGRPIEKDPGTNMATGLMARLLNPVPKVGDIGTASKLDLALLNYNNRVEAGDFEGERPRYPIPPRKTFTRNGQTYTWSPTEYVELVRRSGELARERLERSVQSGSIDWRNPETRHVEQIERAIRMAREKVANDLWRARQGR